MSRQYYDIEGALISLYKLVRQEPEWAQSRIEQTEDYEKLQAENAALRQRVAELEKDAKRYRWLRQERTETQMREVFDIIDDSCEEYMDAAIDAAMLSASAQSKE